MGKVDHSMYKNDWIWSLFLVVISIILSNFNNWISLFLAIGALFFGVSSLKAGNKLGLIGIFFGVIVIIMFILSIFIWQYVWSM